MTPLYDSPFPLILPHAPEGTQARNLRNLSQEAKEPKPDLGNLSQEPKPGTQVRNLRNLSKDLEEAKPGTKGTQAGNLRNLSQEPKDQLPARSRSLT